MPSATVSCSRQILFCRRCVGDSLKKVVVEASFEGISQESCTNFAGKTLIVYFKSDHILCR
jgi:hypothetical protein